MLYSDPFISIYFGDEQDQIFPVHYAAKISDSELLAIHPFNKLENLLSIKRLHFPKQIHSSIGYEVSSCKIDSFAVEGDYLLTDKHAVGIGVMTADCLPIILHDTKHHAVAVVHAGRRGALARIAFEAVGKMNRCYGTSPTDLRVFFGPSIKKCCYEIGDDIAAEIVQSSYGKRVLDFDRRTLFDLPLYNRLELELIEPAAFNDDYNICTACDPIYCSYRRDGQQAGRQMTVVALK